MNRSETISLLGFVPALVVQYLSENKKVVQLPDKQSFKSVVMFADISGFTNLTETLHKMGHEGCEMTAFAINRYMELLVKAISRSGGDIFKFAGDAMIVVWPPPDSEGKTSLETLCRQAIQSALDIQAKLHDTYILKNIKLSVKIGFGIGQISIVYTGGIFGRCEYLASGDPLTQAFHSEHHASQGGETLISQEVYDMVKDFFDFQENPADAPECFHVLRVKGKVRMKADALIIKNNLDMMKFEKIRQQLLGYIPAALLPYIENGQESWGNELRNLTIMFLNLGVDLSCTQTTEGLQRIQVVIQTVQKCIYMHEGSLNKLLMDDKGSTLIVVFGLPPMCHQDDATRAILTAFLLSKELKKLHCPVSIGIATGTVFAGVVGTSGSRREYSVLGDEVNISARLMQLACSEKREKIILCGKTKEQSSGAVTSVFYKEVALKGKAKPVEVFVPLDPVKEQKSSPVIAMIKVHQESGLIKYEDIMHLKTLTFGDEELRRQPTTAQEESKTQLMEHIIAPPQPIIGNTSSIEKAMRSFCAILSGEQERQLLIMSGSFGVGKSHVLKICMHRVVQMIGTKEFGKYKYNENPHIMVTVLNPVDRKLKMNGLRLVLRQILTIIAARNKRQVHAQFLGEFFEETRKGIHDLQLLVGDNEKYFKEFCSLINPPLEPIQHFPAPNPEPVKEEVKALTAYVSAMLSGYLDSDVMERKISVMKSSKNQSETLNVAPLILVFPNSEHLDEPTFIALRHIMKRYPRIMLVMLTRDQNTEIPMVGVKTQDQIAEVVGDGIYRISEGLQKDEIVEIKFSTLQRQGINPTEEHDEYKQFIKLHFGIEEFKEDINIEQLHQEREEDQQSYFEQRSSFKRTRAKDANQSNTREQCIRQKMRDHLLFYDSKHDLIDINFSEYVYHYLYLKTMGHALATKQWINMFVQRNLITIERKVGIVSQELKKVFVHEEAIVLDVPFIYTQINGQIIDKLGCFNCLILKVASVIGDIFDLNTLGKIHPFQETINNEKLIKLLEELEQKHIIEVMEVQTDNVYYRFMFPFFRESIYQRMTYAQRRQIHQLVAETYQLMPQVYDFDEKISEGKLMVHWELSEKKDSELKQNVSHKAKRAFIVKRLRLVLTTSECTPYSIVFSGILSKKSEQNITWSSRQCRLTPQMFQYYYNTHLTEDSIPLGSFLYKHVQSITALNEPTQAQKLFGGQKNVLQIKTSQWIKKTKTILEERKFYFGADNEEQLEQWIIYLEFLKAKAVYEEFVEQFGKIPFPLQPPEKNNILQLSSVKDQNRKFQFRSQMQQSKCNRLLSQRVSKLSIFKRATRHFLTEQNPLLQVGTSYIINEDPANNWQNEIQNLKPYLNQFLIKSLYVLFAHMFQMSMSPLDPVQLGERLKIMVKHPQIFKVNKDQLKRSTITEETSSQRQSELTTILEEEQPQQQQKPIVKQSLLQLPSQFTDGTPSQRARGSVQPPLALNFNKKG